VPIGDDQPSSFLRLQPTRIRELFARRRSGAQPPPCCRMVKTPNRINFNLRFGYTCTARSIIYTWRWHRSFAIDRLITMVTSLGPDYANFASMDYGIRNRHVNSGKENSMRSVGSHLNTFHDSSGKITVSVFSHVGSPRQEHWIEEEILAGDVDMIAIGGGGAASENPGALLTASHPNDDLRGWVVSSKDHEFPDAHSLVTYVIGLKIAGINRDQLRNSIFISVADSGVTPHPEAETGVPDDSFVMIGGGFRVDWHGAGNLATASFPATEFSWKARSRDHLVSDPSNIRVFAVCLRRDLPVGRVVTSIQRADSGQEAHPAAVANVADGFALTGGGAEVRTDGLGNLLWKLEPSTSNLPIFTAASKDHLEPSPGSITAYAMGIRF
jgi:hypothetical protein